MNYRDRLDRTFAALVDPTRRAILAQLERKDGASISELAEPFAIKLPVVMKHIDVLDDAGFITRFESSGSDSLRDHLHATALFALWLNHSQQRLLMTGQAPNGTLSLAAYAVES